MFVGSIGLHTGDTGGSGQGVGGDKIIIKRSQISKVVGVNLLTC